MPRRAWGEGRRKNSGNEEQIAMTSKGVEIVHRRECCSRPQPVTTLTLKFLPEER